MFRPVFVSKPPTEDRKQVDVLLKEILLALLIALYGKQPLSDHARTALPVIEEIVQVDEPLLPTTDVRAREKTARILMVFAYHESRFRADAIGDSGNSLGIVQVNRMFLGQHTAEEVLASQRLGLRLGLSVMRKLTAQCGSLSRGLQAYATGRCGGAPKMIAARCRLAGLSSSCD